MNIVLTKVGLYNLLKTKSALFTPIQKKSLTKVIINCGKLYYYWIHPLKAPCYIKLFDKY